MGVRLCRKVSYYSQLSAKVALMNQQHKDTAPKRMYRCTQCTAWHLTSKERDNAEK